MRILRTKGSGRVLILLCLRVCRVLPEVFDLLEKLVADLPEARAPLSRTRAAAAKKDVKQMDQRARLVEARRRRKKEAGWQE